MIEQLNQTWTGILQYLNGIVVPDWGGLVNLLPIFLLIGVVGPLLSLVVLFWFIYFVRKPRLRVEYVDPRRPAPRDDRAAPSSRPASRIRAPRRWSTSPAPRRSDAGDPLLVRCPKCDLVRPAEIDTCGNCGLSFVIRQADDLGPTRRPAARRRRGRLRSPEMAQASSILFVLGAIVVALGFAAHVGHAVLLANGRRACSPSRRPASPPSRRRRHRLVRHGAGLRGSAPLGADGVAQPALRRRSCSRPRPSACWWPRW